jgi:hypothetical protein
VRRKQVALGLVKHLIACGIGPSPWYGRMTGVLATLYTHDVAAACVLIVEQRDHAGKLRCNNASLLTTGSAAN